MTIHSEQEAMYLACEMESTAVQLYTRALQLMEQLGRQNEPLHAELQQMLKDEQAHLVRFRSLYKGLDASEEQQLSLSAVADGILFDGGLMGAARKGLLSDVESMMRFAADSERMSAQKYRDFAAVAATEEAKQALLKIAQEEDGHLRELENAAK
ncbi:MAG: ferritin-like domain-containing protein [Clostridia bacterium]|nr:ferritin-like domain-containing protein [Clostridia bacterium]